MELQRARFLCRGQSSVVGLALRRHCSRAESCADVRHVCSGGFRLQVFSVVSANPS
jgi:hypothetical protein